MTSTLDGSVGNQDLGATKALPMVISSAPSRRSAHSVPTQFSALAATCGHSAALSYSGAGGFVHPTCGGNGDGWG